MSTRPHTTKATSHATAAASHTTVTSALEPPLPEPGPAIAPAPASPPASPPPPPAPADSGVFIAPPPANANIPSVPDGFEPTSGASYRGTQPRKAELVALPLAMRDLANFKSYATVIGGTAPPLDEVQQTFGVTNAWSTMRNASSAWDAYSRDQEGIAWVVMRSMMGRLKPAFQLAARTNPSVATTYAGLAALLGAKTVIAKKAVATKKKNKQDAAEGKEPTAGLVGKKREKAAAKAALAAQKASAAAGATAPVSVPATTTPAIADATPAPVATATPAPSNGATNGSNGVPHS